MQMHYSVKSDNANALPQPWTLRTATPSPSPVLPVLKANFLPYKDLHGSTSSSSAGAAARTDVRYYEEERNPWQMLPGALDPLVPALRAVRIDPAVALRS